MTTASTPLCSFCVKPADEVNKLIAGPGTYICDGCVQLCTTILEQDTGASQPSETALWDEQGDDELLAALPRMAKVSAQVDGRVQTLVDLLRSRGVAWARIGAALGVTRQTAWERFSGDR